MIGPQLNGLPLLVWADGIAHARQISDYGHRAHYALCGELVFHSAEDKRCVVGNDHYTAPWRFDYARCPVNDGDSYVALPGRPTCLQCLAKEAT